jgi:hypothetical protein
LERNRAGIQRLAATLGEERGGTLLLLGAGRLLDVAWEQLFPRFERVVLFDADFCIVPFVERLVATSKVPHLPKPLFEIGDLTGSVVDTAAWAEQRIQSARSLSSACDELVRGFGEAGTPPAPWTRTYADVRMVISTNLLSQLGYYPRRHIQNVFKQTFNRSLDSCATVAQSLERYFDRVRARHIHDLSGQRGARMYLSADVSVMTYRLVGRMTQNLLAEAAPVDGGVTLDDSGRPKFKWNVDVLEETDPLNGQNIRDLFPQPGNLTCEKWVWHIVPEGAEAKYRDTGRIHIVEGWSRK